MQPPKDQAPPGATRAACQQPALTIAIGFVVFVFLALLSLAMVWILKYMPVESEEGRVGLGPPEVS